MGPCSLIQHNKTIREILELWSNIQIESSHNQLNGSQMEIPNPGFFNDSFAVELPHSKWVTEMYIYSFECVL